MSKTRITNGDLDAIAARLNRMTGSPAAPYIRDTAGTLRAQIGNYHISHCYGGVCLHRMVNAAGGVSDVLMCGHIPKRELYTAMFAYIERRTSAPVADYPPEPSAFVLRHYMVQS